ncbi:MAG: glycoside hydrolase family 43 protein [Prevotella sp.]|nr:glycoside hydrolase family 43 protein [Prevotella sp.]
MYHTAKKLFLSASVMLSMGAAAQNMPIIQTQYTADPAPMVHNDTVFLYTTHDEDDATGFKMYDWLLFTSTDMVNWTAHGAVASTKNFAWRSRDNGAWAEQVVERNGKYYMYCPLHGHGIGVLVSDSPYGPFHDPLGKPLVWNPKNWYDIDPTVFIDDDGQAYMYWGNPNTYYVRLNEDMISVKDTVTQIPHINDYQEGPWFYKRNGHYYLAFASTCCPEGIGYAMSDSPTGPWTYRGHIMDHTPKTRGNHPGIIDYKGKSYVFGLNYDILRLQTKEHSERRSVSVAEMHYNADGTIQEVPYFKEATLKQIESFNPYQRVEAETMAWGYGLKIKKIDDKGICVTSIDDGDSLIVKGVDFGKNGAKEIFACVASDKEGSSIEVRLDSADGKLVGTLPVPSTGSMSRYGIQTAKIKGAKGVHNLVFVFRGSAKTNLFNWDFWEMK